MHAVNRDASVYRQPMPGVQCHNDKEPILDFKHASRTEVPKSPMSKIPDAAAKVLFATHDTWESWILGHQNSDGKRFCTGFLQKVHVSVRSKIRRCPCNVTLRFGTQGTLKSAHPMVVPVGGLNSR